MGDASHHDILTLTNSYARWHVKKVSPSRKERHNYFSVSFSVCEELFI
jgi:hypothetical protein